MPGLAFTKKRVWTPILRSPLFPGIAIGVADVARRGPAVAFDATRVAEVAAAIARERVGGRFWGRPIVGARHLIVASDIAHLDAAEGEGTIVWPVGTAIADAARKRGLAVAPADADPWSLIDAAEVVSGDPAHEVALLAACAGKLPLDPSALHSHLIDTVAYRDPFTGASSDPLAAIDLLGFWRRWIDANRGIAAAAGMAWWKRAEIARFLWAGQGTIPFLRPAAAIAVAAPADGVIATWPSRVPADFADQATAAGARVHLVEDGFLRSPGLGADLHPPLSVVVDGQGIYYDPSRPCDLETILATHEFPPAIKARADRLRQRIVTRGIGKYGVSTPAAVLDLPAGRRIVLVAGQVEDDMSVLAGGAGVAGNRDLLERARAAEPDAYLLFRPHPDVEAGHRKGAVPDAEALRFADVISRGGSLAALLEQVDSVHVLSSLTGFEALLRNRDVVIHGQPFFAGWGLTRDLAPAMLRRNKKLELDELIAGALILYPRYLDPRTGLPCPPETFLDAIVPARSLSPLIRLRQLQGRLRKWFQRRYVAA
ncbi:beta-3-deoxy-D-manno-oct-2-ulosonic acid transferase [Sphingomonas naphthae]|uniref:Beta-3-deoxy-D-manno-oct-2-ulosonic acid transferase n=1 Tax=Sphingomonas naphthae TaxID=1813468 RepID=A0ABY7TNP5_9SPHN|nr:beta-3-deoxy-D-manno-oct-2-ulosonic acid transferase [Sphingomonas naphthae]WCT74857.1 beta-3-deoxy-D-manno-oct-2-ulosonic acid transferase [Sphingomonas naphthae]